MIIKGGGQSMENCQKISIYSTKWQLVAFTSLLLMFMKSNGFQAVTYGMILVKIQNSACLHALNTK